MATTGQIEAVAQVIAEEFGLSLEALIEKHQERYREVARAVIGAYEAGETID